MTVENILHIEKDIIKIAIYLGATPEQSRDLVQDCFLKLLEIQAKEGNIDRLRYGDQVNMGYIFAIVKNTYINRSKECARFQDCEPPDQAIQVDELTDHVKEVISKLPFSWYERKLTEVYLFQGYSMAELSKVTRISKTNIFNTLKSTKSKIKANLIIE